MVASMSPAAAFLATVPVKHLGDEDILQPELTVPFVLLLCLVSYIVLCLPHPSWQLYTPPRSTDLILVAMCCLLIRIVFTVVVIALSLAGDVSSGAFRARRHHQG